MSELIELSELNLQRNAEKITHEMHKICNHCNTLTTTEQKNEIVAINSCAARIY